MGRRKPQQWDEERALETVERAFREHFPSRFMLFGVSRPPLCAMTTGAWRCPYGGRCLCAL